MHCDAKVAGSIPDAATGSDSDRGISLGGGGKGGRGGGAENLSPFWARLSGGLDAPHFLGPK